MRGILPVRRPFRIATRVRHSPNRVRIGSRCGRRRRSIRHRPRAFRRRWVPETASCSRRPSGRCCRRTRFWCRRTRSRRGRLGRFRPGHRPVRTSGRERFPRRVPFCFPVSPRFPGSAGMRPLGTNSRAGQRRHRTQSVPTLTPSRHPRRIVLRHRWSWNARMHGVQARRRSFGHPGCTRHRSSRSTRTTIRRFARLWCPRA